MEDKLEQIKQHLTKVISKHSWAKDCDYDAGSMSEAHDIGICQGQTELAKEILKLLEK